jgi:hypothetical protein
MVQRNYKTRNCPLIEEYWFDKEEKASLEIKRLYLNA